MGDSLPLNRKEVTRREQSGREGTRSTLLLLLSASFLPPIFFYRPKGVAFGGPHFKRMPLASATSLEPTFAKGKNRSQCIRREYDVPKRRRFSTFFLLENAAFNSPRWIFAPRRAKVGASFTSAGRAAGHGGEAQGGGDFLGARRDALKVGAAASRRRVHGN